MLRYRTGRSALTHRLNDGEVSPKASMSAGARHAQKDAIGGSTPARFRLSAVHTGAARLFFEGGGEGVITFRGGHGDGGFGLTRLSSPE